MTTEPTLKSRFLLRRPSLMIAIISVVALLFGIAEVGGLDRVAKNSNSDEHSALPSQDKDYSRFTHTNPYHSRMPCLLCHRRDSNSPRIGFPGRVNHLPCAGCHALQFSDNSSPICTICHTDAQTGALKGFPGLQSFGRKF